MTLLYRPVLYRPRGGDWDTFYGPVSETPQEAANWLTENLRPGIDGGNIEEMVPGIGWVVYTGDAVVVD